MAANTTFSLSLQAKDWEVIVSLMYGTSQNDLRKIISDLINYYAVNGNPQAATLVPITVKEKSVVKIFDLFYGNTVSRLYNDVGGSSFKRVIDAIRAANNTADNYILTELTARDAQRNADQVAFRKSGREYLMMEGYDNN